MKKLIISLFSDQNGIISMKRLCGLICTLTLCFVLIMNVYKPEMQLPLSLINSVGLLAFGCLGLTSAEKIWEKQKKEDKETVE